MSDQVRCVVTVGQITEHRNWWKRDSSFKGNAKTIELNGIQPGERVPEDLRADAAKFYDASPSIQFKLGTVNPEAAAFFEIDGIYEVAFRKIGELE